MEGSWPTVTDPDGREVVFDAGSHLHLALSRAWALDAIDLIMATVEAPDIREPDPYPGRERYFRRHLLEPSRWLRVVVDFNDSPGWVVTALAQDVHPRRRS